MSGLWSCVLRARGLRVGCCHAVAARQVSALGTGQGRPASRACAGAGSTTRLLRSDAAQEATLADAADYGPRLAAAGITLSAERRAGDIWAGAQVRRQARAYARQAAAGGWRVLQCLLPTALRAALPLKSGVSAAGISESGASRSRAVASVAPDVVRRAPRPARHGPGPQAAAAAAGGAVPESARRELLHEVAALVEAPTVLAGAFDAAFLALPRRVAARAAAAAGPSLSSSCLGLGSVRECESAVALCLPGAVRPGRPVRLACPCASGGQMRGVLVQVGVSGAWPPARGDRVG